jgi:hypothetical protein
MIFTVGLFVLGAARMLAGSLSGMLPFVMGGLLSAVVRPHVTALLLLGLSAALLGKREPAMRPAHLLVIPSFAVLTLIVSDLVSQILPNLDQGLFSVIEATQERTSIGGSVIEVTSPNSVTEYPFALATVLFRPFLFEARSLLQLLSAIEGTVLIVWLFVRRASIGSVIRLIWSSPWYRLALVYVLTFGFAWSSVGNLGIITRQRVQVIPFLLLILVAARDRPAATNNNDQIRSRLSG